MHEEVYQNKKIESQTKLANQSDGPTVKDSNV